MSYYRPLRSPSSFRKLAAAMWRAPNDPHIYGTLEIDISSALDLLQRYNARFVSKVTITHMVVRALAMALAKHPEANGKIEFSRILLRNRVDIFCQVSTDSGRDLSGNKLEGVDALSLAQIESQLSGAARAIRKDEDPNFRRSRSLFKLLPVWALRWVLLLISLLTNRLNLHLPTLGLPRDPFGSAMVSSVGMFGVDEGFAPFTPIARCPVILAVPRIKRRPWVIDDDKIEARPVLRLCGTFDHRIIDGFHAAQLSREIETLLSEPTLLLLAGEQDL